MVKKSQKEVKMPGICLKIIFHPNLVIMTLINAIISMFTHLKREYDMLHKLDLNYNQRTNKCKKGQKRVVKIPGICQKIIRHPNHDTFERKFCHVYTIYKCAYDNL